jgi:hypothetical protein
MAIPDAAQTSTQPLNSLISEKMITLATAKTNNTTGIATDSAIQKETAEYQRGGQGAQYAKNVLTRGTLSCSPPFIYTIEYKNYNSISMRGLLDFWFVILGVAVLSCGLPEIRDNVEDTDLRIVLDLKYFSGTGRR